MGLTVDSFAGGGGASTGIEMAGCRVDIAINHDPAAIAMHKINHPDTRHYCEDIWAVDPREACQGRKVDFMWASPDCKHFSKASGGALKDRNIRGLAWVILCWAGTVRPACIIVENVEEFVTWGPVRKGKPVKAKAGETYRRWRGQLERLGYRVESRELIAADYGVPTSRKRFYLIARCDGLPIVWPEPTHGDPNTLEVAAGVLKPWRTAGEIIDWSLPCPSIFEGKAEIRVKYGVNAVRPLAAATMRRIARGLDKFTLKNAQPYIMINNNSWAHTNCTGMDDPLRTVTTGRQNLLCAPSLIKYHGEQGERARGQNLNEPMYTVDAANRFGLSTAYLSEYYGNAQDGLDLNAPMRTVTARDRESLTVAHIEKYYSGGYTGSGSAADAPIGTVTSKDHNGVVAAHVVKFKGQNVGQPAEMPLQTLTASPGVFGVVKTRVERYAPGANLRYWPEVRAMLNEFCGYTLADDEILLLLIQGVWYYIADIGLRMITAREAFRAQGFPDEYIIDFEWLDKPFPKSEQMAKAGNSVCPPVVAALVKANHRPCSGQARLHNAAERTPHDPLRHRDPPRPANG